MIHSSRGSFALVLALFIALGLFHFLTIRDGHPWGDDFAQYISHARNIVEGRSYADTGYVYNPQNTIVGPRAYPPVFPCLIAIPYALRGLDLYALKLVPVLALVLAVVAVYVVYGEKLRPPARLLLVALVGFNYLLWTIRDTVVSDTTFFALVFLALVVVDRLKNRDPVGVPAVIVGAVTGVVFYLAAATRSLGIVLPAALITWDLLRRRRISVYAISAAVTCMGLVTIQQWMIGFGERSYADQLIRLPAVESNIRESVSSIQAFFSYGGAPWGPRLLLLITIPLAVIGIRKRLQRNGVGVDDVFYVLYLVLVIFWPAPTRTPRYFIPVFPAFLCYVLLGIDTAAEWIGSRARTAILTGVVVALLGSDLVAFSRTNLHQFPITFDRPEFRAVVDVVRTRLGHSTVTVFEKPRLLALLTRGRSCSYPITDDMAALHNNLRDLAAGAVIEAVPDTSDPYDEFATDARILHRFIGTLGSRAQLVFSNVRYKLYLVDLQ